MPFKVSNETKVGALAAIAITFLVLGYNFLSGKGSLFSRSYTLNAILTDVTDISTSTPVLFNGYKVGNVTDIEFNNKESNFKVSFDITEDIDIPVNSRVKVVGALLGGKSILLLKSDAKENLPFGSTLTTVADTSLTESIGLVVKPLTIKINSIVNSLDSLLAHGELNASIASLNASLKSFTRTSDNASLMLEKSMPKLDAILSNVESISLNLKNNNEKITLIVSNLKTTTDNLAAAKIKEAVDKANEALAEVSAIMMKINKGEGTLGLLVNDKELYNNLNKTAIDLDIILKDLNQYPAKYIPIPFTKKQRKKAIEASKTGKK
ncbi:MAG: MlaD family protein [Bacteroidota bacterium]